MLAIDEQKIIDHATAKLPMPWEIDQKICIVLVPDHIGQVEQANRYFEIDLFDVNLGEEFETGRTLKIDKIEDRYFYKVIFKKEYHDVFPVGWSLVGLDKSKF